MNVNHVSVLLAAVYIVCISSIQVQAFIVDNCNKDSNSALAKLGQITINGCGQSTDAQNASCIMERGTNMSIGVEFVPTTALESVRVKISGKIHGVPLPFPVRPDEACGNYGLVCPLKPNENASFKMLLPVLRSYPKLHVDVVLELRDPSKKTIVCLTFPADIKDKLVH